MQLVTYKVQMELTGNGAPRLEGQLQSDKKKAKKSEKNASGHDQRVTKPVGFARFLENGGNASTFQL